MIVSYSPDSCYHISTKMKDTEVFRNSQKRKNPSHIQYKENKKQKGFIGSKHIKGLDTFLNNLQWSIFLTHNGSISVRIAFSLN